MDAQQWLQRSFGCRLRDTDLLDRALSHRSVGRQNNERLEFLGDAVLDLVISEALYHRFPGADEGQLTRMRISLVREETLAEIATEIDVGENLRLGSNANRGGGRQRRSILADALEALLGALYVDRGVDACREVILKLFAGRLDTLDPAKLVKNPKTRLQELLQKRGVGLPVYEVLEVRGRDHEREFSVRCSLADGSRCADGDGESRQAAEKAAASRLLDQLEASS